jgi:D-3-phosphoglycerate dehydrogenase
VDTHVEIPIYGQGNVVVQVEKVSFEELLKTSDAVSLHIPKQKDGSAVLKKAELEMMKRGAILVNAARGGVVDEDALIEILNSGHLAGAALDVFENEPNPRPDLLNHPKITTTPHIGAATDEAQERIGVELADLIIADLKPA